MKTLVLLVTALISTSCVWADDKPTPSVEIQRQQLGSGTPGLNGLENATIVDDGIYFAPQYMPYYPTAASIWPRVVEVPCKNTENGLSCEGYDWSPKLGRGEYLFIKPVVIAEPVTLHPEVIREIEIIKEVKEPEVIKPVVVVKPHHKKLVKAKQQLVCAAPTKL